MSAAWRTGIVLLAAILASLVVGLISRHDAPAQVTQVPSSQGEAPGENVMNCRLRQFANGVTRVSPIFRVDVKATNDDWAELARLLRDFADSHEWSFKDYSLARPGVVKTLELSLCGANQPRIEVAEQRWASDNWAPGPGRGTVLYFYGDVAETEWHPLAIEVVGMLEKRWQVGFIDDDGYHVDRPTFLGDYAPPAQ
jgi:hypothetical protein